MKTNHTPGPWRYEKEDEGDRHFVAWEETECEDTTICTANYGEADGKLIAAAPEMLEALKEILAIPEVKYTRSCKDWIAIIEKATGKTWAEIKEAGE